MSDQWLRPLSHGNRGQQCESSDAFFHTKPRAGVQTSGQKFFIVWCALTFTFLPIVCLIRRMNLTHFCQVLSSPPPFLSCWKRASFTLTVLLKNLSHCRLRFLVALSEGMHRQASVARTPCFYLFWKENVSAFVSTRSWLWATGSTFFQAPIKDR